jgi:hypothetical protein
VYGKEEFIILGIDGIPQRINNFLRTYIGRDQYKIEMGRGTRIKSFRAG